MKPRQLSLSEGFFRFLQSLIQISIKYLILQTDFLLLIKLNLIVCHYCNRSEAIATSYEYATWYDRNRINRWCWVKPRIFEVFVERTTCEQLNRRRWCSREHSSRCNLSKSNRSFFASSRLFFETLQRLLIFIHNSYEHLDECFYGWSFI